MKDWVFIPFFRREHLGLLYDKQYSEYWMRVPNKKELNGHRHYPLEDAIGVILIAILLMGAVVSFLFSLVASNAGEHLSANLANGITFLFAFSILIIAGRWIYRAL